MRNFKGFVFTVDAVFSLIVAAASISMLLFVVYIPTFSSQPATSQAQGILQTMLQTTLGQLAPATPAAAYAVDWWRSSQFTWANYGYNASNPSGTPSYGPQLPLLAFDFQAPNTIYPMYVGV